MSDHLEIVRHAISSLTAVPDTAAQVHVAVADVLSRWGYTVLPEYRAADGGRIDLVISSGEWRAAIEIDARRPRARSLVKLRDFDGAKIIALRGVEALCPFGVDAVVIVPVRTALDAERADRRTVSRMRL